jgi:hypothetical protein
MANDNQGGLPAAGAEATMTSKATRVRIASLGLGGMLALGLTTAGPAAADSVVGGVQFSSSVNCGGSFLTVTSNSATDGGSWVLVWVWDGAKWVHDSVWRNAGEWASFFAADISFAPGYYTVYLQYAQWTGSAYSFGGEFVRSYRYVTGAVSSACYLQ